MKQLLVLILWIFMVMNGFSQTATFNDRLEVMEEEFLAAYQIYPDLHPGILEAMVWYHSKGIDIKPSVSCIGIPQGRGLFALVENGEGFFLENEKLILDLTGMEEDDLYRSNSVQISAMAHVLYMEMQSSDSDLLSSLLKLSSIPNGSRALAFARLTEVYGILSLLNDPDFQQAVPDVEPMDLEAIFGHDLKVLQSSTVLISGNEIHGENGTSFRGGEIGPCFDFAADAFVQTPSCNYNARSEPISAVTVHTVQGSYAGAIGWAQNCTANVSYHYVVRSSDGQITQMLCEADRGWHVGTENDYAIGIEHEGYVSDPAWYTSEMYLASAGLVSDIANSGYGIDPHRTAYYPWAADTYYNVSGIPGNCNKIKGHQHFPNQTHTDPGTNWDWDHYYKLIDPLPVLTAHTTATGIVADDGGEIGPYSVDGRYFTLIQPIGATPIDLTFSVFDLENEWDYLYIYDGDSEFDPLIGYYTGSNSPGTINSTGGSLLLEFRSDCSISYAGWVANYTSDAVTVGIESMESEIKVYPNPTAGVVQFSKQVEQVSVVDITGKLLGSDKSRSRSIDLTEFTSEPGIYILKIEAENAVIRQQVTLHK